jgi:hypothetical protein
MNPTFAQLPGLQKVSRILELQQLIATHQNFCTKLLEIFNDLVNSADALESLTGISARHSRILKNADQIQVICEWHMAQRVKLEQELKEIS